MTEAELVVLVRHGETEWSRSGQHTGRTDLALTEAGEEEARRLRPILARYRFAAVFTSPMQRARVTAQLAGLDGAVIDDELREWDYGDHEGRTSAEIQSDLPGWTIWNGPWPGGETAEQVGARADRVLARIRSVSGGAVAVVAHGHILRVLAARWLGADPRSGQWLKLTTASISGLGYERERPVIDHWNLTAAFAVE